jgi:hypothetical protein
VFYSTENPCANPTPDVTPVAFRGNTEGAERQKWQWRSTRMPGTKVLMMILVLRTQMTDHLGPRYFILLCFNVLNNFQKDMPSMAHPPP